VTAWLIPYCRLQWICLVTQWFLCTLYFTMWFVSVWCVMLIIVMKALRTKPPPAKGLLALSSTRKHPKSNDKEWRPTRKARKAYNLHCKYCCLHFFTCLIYNIAVMVVVLMCGFWNIFDCGIATEYSFLIITYITSRPANSPNISNCLFQNDSNNYRHSNIISFIGFALWACLITPAALLMLEQHRG